MPGSMQSITQTKKISFHSEKVNMMNNADEKMKDDFYDWLNECPVNWVRLKVNDETIHYAFETPDEEGNDE